MKEELRKGIVGPALWRGAHLSNIPDLLLVLHSSSSEGEGRGGVEGGEGVGCGEEMDLRIRLRKG